MLTFQDETLTIYAIGEVSLEISCIFNANTFEH